MSELLFTDCEPPLSRVVLDVIDRIGFARMTPVQSAVIPLFLTNKDVCVEACTGSGKTLAFLIPLVEMLMRCDAHKSDNICGIVLAPTRELATQISSVLQPFADACRLRVLAAVGGTSTAQDLTSLRVQRPHVLVATPGRLRDLLEREGAPTLRALECLILDEADVLLAMGFAETVTAILSKLPKQRRTGMFSATQTVEVKALARAGLRNPATVRVAVHADAAVGSAAVPGAGEDTLGPVSRPEGVQQTPQGLSSMYMTCAAAEKLAVLVRLVSQHCAAARRPAGPPVAAASARANAAATQAPAPAPVPGMARATTTAPEKLSKKQRKRAREKARRATAARARAAVKTAQPSRTLGEPALAQSHPTGKFIVFVATCAGVDFVAGLAARLGAEWGWPEAIPLHGRMAPKKRIANFERFAAAPTAVLLCTDVAARGIDVPDVDWIVQFDPPRDPDFFVHRVGRTARAGRRGKSVVLLLPSEETYVHFLQVKNVPLAPIPLPPASTGDDARALVARCREVMRTDRGLVDAAARAFVSAVRAYKEHQCHYIFRLEEWDVGGVAESHCLFRLPKLPDLRGRRIEFKGDAAVDVDAIPYANRDKEQARLRKAAAAPDTPVGGVEVAKPATRSAESKAAPRAKRKAKLTRSGEERRVRKGKNRQMLEEWEELRREELLHKKHRRGAISTEELQAALRGGDGSVDPDIAALENPALLGGASGSEGDEEATDANPPAAKRAREARGGPARRKSGRKWVRR